jgi:biofilm PGA synthesis lipoprotein PgaB
MAVRKAAVLFLSILILVLFSSCVRTQSVGNTVPGNNTEKQQPVEQQSSGQSLVKEPPKEQNETEPPVKPTQETEEKIEEKPSAEKPTESDTPENKVYYEGKAVVLTYHHISTKPVSSISIKPERFEQDLKMLKENNFNVISFRDMINGINGQGKLPPNAVVITFDDGYESFYKYAYPLLKKYSMPAVNFVITSWTEGIFPTSGEFKSLEPGEIQEMYKSGLVDIQSHSHNGHDYIVRNEKGQTGGYLAYQIYDTKTKTYEPEADYKKRVLDDLSTSIPIIKKYTGNDPDTLCFPFGHFNPRLVSLGKQAGFKYFVTTLYGSNKEGSKNIFIYRIRSGDAKLNSAKLKQNIIECGAGNRGTQATP